MNPPPVVTLFGTPDPEESPLNLKQLFELANRLVRSYIDGPYVPNIIQNGTPKPEDQDKIWLELDSQARPIALKTYWHGHWRRVYNGMMGEVRGFSGDPGYNNTGNFDKDGLGNIGGMYDGWGLCNGKGGRPDYSNQFLCGANMNPPTGTPSGYDDGWQTLIDDKVHKGGGQWTEKLQPKNIPLPQLQPTIMSKYIVAGADTDETGTIWGIKTNDNQHRIPGFPDDLYTYPPDGYKGNPDPEGLFVGPPFYSAAWIIFVGYS